MAFVKKTWIDRVVQYANRRLLTKSGGEVEQVTVTRDEGTISEAGDQFNASNMNDLEQRVEDGFDDLNAADLPITSGSSTNTKDYIDNKTAYKSYSINNIDVYRWGNVVFFNIITGTNTTDASGLIVSGGSNVVIKNGYRPVNNVNMLDTVSGNRMTCNADGTVWTGVVSQSGQTFRLSGCWITTDAMPT